jgi:hypothetical protein
MSHVHSSSFHLFPYKNQPPPTFKFRLNILKWKRNDNKPNTVFIIECRSGAASNEWMQIGVTQRTAFEHRLPKAGEQCLYRVYAARNEQNSPYSNEAIVYLNFI